MQLEVNESGDITTSNAGNVIPMLPFVKSSSIVSRGQEKMRGKQQNKLESIERPAGNEENTFWNDGLSMPMFHIEEQKGVLSGKIARKHGNPLNISPPFGKFKRDLIHPSMLSTRCKSKRVKKRRKLGFNIDEHLAQLKRKQTGLGRNLPSAKMLFPERSVTVNRENLTAQTRMLIPNETRSIHTSMGKMWDRDQRVIHSPQALLEETNEAGQDHNHIDVKFDPAEIDDITNPFLWKPRMMYPIELKHDSIQEENKFTLNTFPKFEVEE